MKGVLIFKHVREKINGKAMKAFSVLFTKASEHGTDQEETDLQHLEVCPVTALLGLGHGMKLPGMGNSQLNSAEFLVPIPAHCVQI